MLTRIWTTVALSGLISACDNPASHLDAEARFCQRALEIGELELAEKSCQRALGDAGGDILAPQVRSERLYRLASIMRQQTEQAARLQAAAVSLK